MIHFEGCTRTTSIINHIFLGKCHLSLTLTQDTDTCRYKRSCLQRNVRI